MKSVYAFSQWDPVRGELPARANASFRKTVQEVRSLVNGRTSEELSAAIVIIRKWKMEWMEARKWEILDELATGAPADGGEDLPSALFLGERAVGSRKGPRWAERADALDLATCFERSGRGERFARLVHADECDVLKECCPETAPDDPRFPAARLHEYFAAWALYKAAAAVLAMWKIEECEKQLDDQDLASSWGEGNGLSRRYWIARKNAKHFSEEFAGAAGLASSVCRQESQRAEDAQPIDRQTMSALGKRGARARYRPTHKVKVLVLERFRAIWKERNWKSVKQATASLVDFAIDRTKEEEALFFCGARENSVKVMYDKWILPYYNAYMKGKPWCQPAGVTHPGGEKG